MTDDFDFDFDVDRGRSASRTEPPQPEEPSEDRQRPRRSAGNGARATGGNGNGSRGNGTGNGSAGYGARAKALLERRGELLYDEDDETDAPPVSPPRRGRPDPEAPHAPIEAAEEDWLSFGGDVFEPGSLSPLRQRDDGPAGPPTPGEARNFAKEARRRASRRPSPILDF